MNSVILIGRLARDPELNYTPQQTAVCNFTLAVDRPRKNGEDQGADFLRIVVFGRQAESCNRYLAKGRQAAVNGRIQTGSYTNREGQKVYTTDIIADRVEFLGGAQDSRPQQTAQPQWNEPERRPPQPEQMIMDDMPGGFQGIDSDIPY